MLNLTQLHMLHTSVPIPHQWKREIKGSFDANLKKSITEPVTIREPVEWCFHEPCCTIDMQKLNFQCYRETSLSVTLSTGMPDLSQQEKECSGSY